MRVWLILLAAGCSTKTNARYCETTCPDPGMRCDTVKHECVAGAPDMGLPDLSVLDDLSVPGGDLSGADFSMPDLTPPPACTMSVTCPADAPVCDGNMCRACNAAADDAECLLHSAATPHCKLAGTNAGKCAACNLNADCPMATPTCNPDGTCRACAANADCDSKICTTSTGACVPESDIVYVNYVNDPGPAPCTETGKDGSRAKPYCQISSALALVAITTKHYVQVEPSLTSYSGFQITGAIDVIIVGPGKDAAGKATVQSAHNALGISIAPASSGLSVKVTLQGLTVIGDGDQNILRCASGNASVPDLTIVDSSFATSANDAVYIDRCNFRMIQSYISGSTKVGLYLAPASSYFVENVFIWGNATGVNFDTANGRFSFNTVANNPTTIGIKCAATGVPIADSIVFNNKPSGGTQFDDSGGTNSCILSNVVTGTADTFSSSGKIALDPVLKSATDLHLDLTAGANLTANQACCIDRINGPGPTPSPSPLPTLDIDGNVRPQGMHWDIGADEAM